jgi:predicted nucleic acid-binding protein
MPVVVADTGPLNYLILIDHIDVLPRLFGSVHIPDAVWAELSDRAAPQAVRTWIAAPPPWLEVRPTPTLSAPSPKLDAGEDAAIALARELNAALLLMDDRAGAAAARAQGFTVTGTLGILGRAAELDLLDLRPALAGLTGTNFHVRPELIAALLAKYAGKE